MKKPRKSNQKLGDIGLIVRAKTDLKAENTDPVHQKRQLIADVCRLVGASLTPKSNPSTLDEPLSNLSPRMQQTLERLLAGDSEKQIALHLSVSKHTVHVYVKAIYKGFSVCSRGELLARFVQAPKFSSSKRK